METNLNNENSTSAFNPDDFLIVPARSFEDLKIGEIFRAPSRTLTAARIHNQNGELVLSGTHKYLLKTKFQPQK